MMRYTLLSIATFIIGYITGIIFGYRSAVVDYVENDAQTIRAMAESMYETKDSDEIPVEVRQAMMEAEEGEEENTAEGGSAFQ